MNKWNFYAAMYSHGDNQESVATALGISAQSVSAKLNGKADFKRDQIATLKDRWNLQPDEVISIFFADELSCEDENNAKHS